MIPWETAVYKRALETWGKTSQMVMCMEEMAELTKELSKNLRGQDNLQHIAEEVADVEIMLEQVKLMFDIRDDVTETKDKKLIRLSDRLVEATGKSDWKTSRSRKLLDEAMASELPEPPGFLCSTYELKDHTD